MIAVPAKYYNHNCDHLKTQIFLLVFSTLEKMSKEKDIRQFRSTLKHMISLIDQLKKKKVHDQINLA